MSKKKAKKQKSKERNTDKRHGRRVMITTDDMWSVWRFEFDAGDGQGVVWHQGRGTGLSNSVENITRHFSEKGYTIVEWK